MIEGQTVAAISDGLLLFVGIGVGDGEKDADRLAKKIAGLRIFSDENGKMNRSVLDVGGQVLVVSQFTLHADCSRGNRPGFEGAEHPVRARDLVDRLAEALASCGITVRTGVFGADMSVSLTNDGPVTILLDTGTM
jgi:D-tyrosyl-tRNA(Tyr) deacylase